MNSYFKSKYFILGIYFLLIQLLIIRTNLGFVETSVFFWFCNHIPLMLSISFFLKKYQFIKGVISVGLIAQLGWVVDFLSYTFFDTFLFGFTEYVFELEGLALISTLTVHFLSTFAALAFTYKVKIKPISLIYSLSYGALLTIITVLFTSREYNTNCVFDLCGAEHLVIPYYTYLVFPVLAIIILIIPGYFIQKLLNKL